MCMIHLKCRVLFSLKKEMNVICSNLLGALRINNKKQTIQKIIKKNYQGPVVQSIISLTSSLRVISLTVLTDSVYNILIKSYSHFFSKTFQHICVSLDVNFNESLTNDIVSFEQLGPE